MLDVSRHFFSVAEIKQTLDAMSLVGLNVFHWHLTDDVGWRIPIDAYPELTKAGAKKTVSSLRTSTMSVYLTDGTYGPFFYTKDEIREVVAYAAAKGIAVMPEIDVPGHSGAAVRSYPELACKGFSDSGELCLGRDKALQFCERVLDEVVELFPSREIHLGGDECNHSRWAKCADCQRRIRELKLRGEKGLQGWFMCQLARYLESKGRRMVAWDDVVDFDDLPKSVVVMCYRSLKKLGPVAARQGHDVIETPDSYCYFDYVQGLEGDPCEYQPFGCVVDWRKLATFDPRADYPAELKGKVLGAQGNMWTELVCDIQGVEWRTWPRLAALADVLVHGPTQDVSAFAERLTRVSAQLKDMGVNVAPMGPLIEKGCLALEPGVRCLWLRPDFAKLLPCALDKGALCFDWNDRRDSHRKIYAIKDSRYPSGSYLLDMDWCRFELTASDDDGFAKALKQLRKLARVKANGVMEFPSCRLACGDIPPRLIDIRSEFVQKTFVGSTGASLAYSWREPRHMQLGANYPLYLLAESQETSLEEFVSDLDRRNEEAFVCVVPREATAAAVDELVASLAWRIRCLDGGGVRRFGFSERLARIGILTDTHVRGDRESAALVERAYQMFKQLDVTAIFHLGDLADRWNPAAYRHYTDVRHEVYPEAASRPLEKYSFGYHDANFYLGRPLAPTKEGRQANAEEAWLDIRTRLEATGEMHDRFELGGFTFLVFPQWPKLDVFRRMVEDACGENPTKPVFILEHIPPFGVGLGSNHYDSFEAGTREILNDYPQVILLHGHTHTNLRDERNFWQGEFTAINCGCLQNYHGGYYVANVNPRRENRNVLTMDLYSDHADFVRWDLDDGSRIGDSWLVRWPKTASEMRLDADLRLAALPVPQFRTDARLSLTPCSDGSVCVGFSDVISGADAALRYRIELFRNGAAEPYAMYDEPGPWCLRPSERGKPNVVTLPSGLVDSGVRSSVRVTPQNFVGKGGRSIEGELFLQNDGWELVWEGSPNGKTVDEYPEGVRFAPPNSTWTGEKGVRFRLSFDFAGGADAIVWVHVDKPFSLVGTPLSVAGLGRDCFRRYAVQFVKDTPDATYSIWVNNSISNDLLIRNVRVYRRTEGD